MYVVYVWFIPKKTDTVKMTYCEQLPVSQYLAHVS